MTPWFDSDCSKAKQKTRAALSNVEIGPDHTNEKKQQLFASRQSLFWERKISESRRNLSSILRKEKTKPPTQQVHRRTIPGGFQRETGRRCRFCSTPPWYGSMQVERARPGPYLGHPKVFSGINSISALFNASMRLGVFHASQKLASVTLLLKNFSRPQQLQANFKSHVPV